MTSLLGTWWPRRRMEQNEVTAWDKDGRGAEWSRMTSLLGTWWPRSRMEQNDVTDWDMVAEETNGAE
ncbi:hypothetical protein BgiBS90_006817 [Biomphalaria glabrata]|nr:hypothetical protein BgiBS90_006817 [Biomphalaria glabrata]